MHKLQVETVQPAHPKQRKCDILVNFMEISISNDEVNLEWIQIFNKQYLVLAKNANLRCLGEVLCVEVADKVDANRCCFFSYLKYTPFQHMQVECLRKLNVIVKISTPIA